MAHETVPVFWPTDDIVSMQQAAEILDVSRPTAVLYAARGYFPTREIAGRTFARRVDVEAYAVTRSPTRAISVEGSPELEPSNTAAALAESRTKA